MAHRQTLVVGALGVLVGVVVGASSAQSAQTISFSGHNPNALPSDYINPRTVNQGQIRTRNGEAYRTTARYTAPKTEQNQQNVHSAAGAPRDDGFEVLDRFFPECSYLYQPNGRNRRYWMCIGRARG